VLTVNDLPSSIRTAATGATPIEMPPISEPQPLQPTEERSLEFPLPPALPSRVRVGAIPPYPLRPGPLASPIAEPISPMHASPAAALAAPPAGIAGAATASALRTAHSLEARVDVLERRIIQDCLARNNYRRKETAAELGISRVTLYNKMKKYGLL
jgi:DNA-binding NtrC family response regulator